MGSFTLDTNVLTGALFFNNYADLPEGGEFRSVQYSFRNSVNNEDVEMHDFSVGMEKGAEVLE